MKVNDCKREPTSLLGLLARTVSILSVAMVAACGGGSENTSEQVGAHVKGALAVRTNATVSSLTVTALVLKAERRVSRTVFEYDYQVVIKNSGIPLSGVIAQVTAVGAGTSIIDGMILVGTMGAGAMATPSDIITLRHDRSVPFQAAALAWQFVADPGVMTSIPGVPTEQAILHIPEYSSEAKYLSTEFEFDLSRGGNVLRSKLIIGFREGTTVAQLNALLQTLSASVVRTYAQTALVEIKIPDPGGMTQLNALLASLRGNAIVSFAIPTAFAPTNELPAVLRTTPSEVDRLFHQIAVKAPAAWNARGAVSSTTHPSGPVLLVADSFGGGVPKPNTLFGTTAAGGFGTGFKGPLLNPTAHGYHVLSIAAASFNGVLDVSDSNSVTGMYAAKERLLELDIEDLVGLGALPCEEISQNACQGTTYEHRLRTILLTHTALGKNVVLNTSFGYNQYGGISVAEAEGLRLYWMHAIRGGFGVTPSQSENRIFHAASAGNKRSTPADQNMGWTRAALTGNSPMTNTAVVENRMASREAPYSPSGMNPQSSLGGNLSAIGSNTLANSSPLDQGIFGYIKADGTSQDRTACPAPSSGASTCALGGTSMAAPQVAGLAAYVWSLKPELSSTELLSLIKQHAVPLGDGGRPLIDAYATILATDDSAALLGTMGKPTKAPVRLAILDVNEDGKFDFEDAKLFVSAFIIAKGGSAYEVNASNVITVPTSKGLRSLDLSRFDLNGDGKVGGTGEARFNLDIKAGESALSSDYGSVSYIGADGKTYALDKQKLTDLNILCYYARSKLWNSEKGDASKLDDYIQSAGLACVGNTSSAPYGKVPPTGMASTQCFGSSNSSLVDCSSPEAVSFSGAGKQDGMRKKAFAFSEVQKVNGGTFDRIECIQDRTTGLVWEGKTPSGPRAGTNTYTYKNDFSPEDTSTYLALLNSMKLCGFDDWRLPSAWELLSITNFALGFDKSWHPNTATAYRSSVESKDYPGDPYTRYLYVFSGGFTTAYTSGKDPVRAVRGVINTPAFTVSADGLEVIDSRTGLIWKRCAEGQSYIAGNCVGAPTLFTADTAFAYAKLQGSWRLPDAKELYSIVDQKYLWPMINPNVFPGASVTRAYATSTPRGPTDAWFVHFGPGWINGFPRNLNNSLFVRLVREP